MANKGKSLLLTTTELHKLCRNCKKLSNCNHWTQGHGLFECIDRDKLQITKVIDILNSLGLLDSIKSNELDILKKRTQELIERPNK